MATHPGADARGAPQRMQGRECEDARERPAGACRSGERPRPRRDGAQEQEAGMQRDGAHAADATRASVDDEGCESYGRGGDGARARVHCRPSRAGCAQPRRLGLVPVRWCRMDAKQVSRAVREAVCQCVAIVLVVAPMVLSQTSTDFTTSWSLAQLDNGEVMLRTALRDPAGGATADRT